MLPVVVQLYYYFDNVFQMTIVVLMGGDIFQQTLCILEIKCSAASSSAKVVSI